MMSSPSSALVPTQSSTPFSLIHSILSLLPFSSSLQFFYSQHVSFSLAALRRRWYLLLPLLLAFSLLNRKLLIRPVPHREPPSPPPLRRTPTVPPLSFKRRRTSHTASDPSSPSSPTSPLLHSAPLRPPLTHTSSTTSSSSRLRFLSQTKYLSSLGEAHLPELFSLMKRRRLLPDDLLFSEGEPCELGMWIVSKGSIGIFDPQAYNPLPGTSSHPPEPLLTSGSPMCVIAPGESIGEWALIGHFLSSTVSYPVRASALQLSEVYFLSRKEFQAFTRRHPRSLMEFVRTAVARQWRIGSYLLEHVLELPPRSREEVQGDVKAAEVDWEEMKDFVGATVEPSQSFTGPVSPLPSFPRGRGVRLLSLAPYDVLFTAGDEASSLYVVATGCLQALSPSSASSAPLVVGSIPAGCVCGGMSLFGSTPRGETIRASSVPTTVYEYTRECIEALLSDDPASLIPIARAVGRQLAPICQQFFELGLDSRWYRAGSIVYEQGEASDAVYLVISGRVHAVRGRKGRGGEEEERRQAGEIFFGTIMADEEEEEEPSPDSHDVYETLFEAGRGETLGEETSFGDSVEEVKRPYSAICVRDTECVRISQSCFNSLFRLNPRSMLRFARSLSHRVHMLASRSSSPSSLPSPRPQPTIATIAIVWIGGSEWGGPRSFILSFGERLMSELIAHGPCVWVDEDRCRREVGDSTVNSLGDLMHRSRASRWMSELEENNRFIVLETTQEKAGQRLSQLVSSRRGSLTGQPVEEKREDRVSAWTRLCVEQADCVLLVCSADSSDTAVSAYEEELLWSSAFASSDDDEDRVDVHLNRYKDLIIVHRQSNPSILPQHTKSWLHGRQLRSHHHLRREVQADYARLARFLAGESIGVVLGGGGARGLAHVGVLQALEEEEIPIDCIGGCSQGAFIAALYAQHLSTADMLTKVQKFASEFTTLGMLRDLTFPLLSYFNGKVFSRAIREPLGNDVMIEDLWISYFCISTNVRRSDINVHRFGLLWRYCRASMTLLGFLPPVIDDNGDLLLDGGYANNLPVDVMASPPSHAHTIIAVDVEDKDLSGFDGLAHLAKRSDFGMSISGLWLLWNKLFGRVKVPDFRQILVFLACLNHSRQLREAAERRIIDLYIRPPIEGIGLLQYRDCDIIIKRGYEAGKKAIRAWKKEMNKTIKQAEDAGEDEEEITEDTHEAAEEKAIKDINERLTNQGGLPILPPISLKDETEEEEKEQRHPVFLPTSSTPSKGALMMRAVSEPSMVQLTNPAQLSLSSSSSAFSHSSLLSPRMGLPHIQRNPSMRMLRGLPHSHVRGKEKEGIRGVLKRLGQPRMKVGWASEESMRERGGSKDEAMETQVRFDRSVSHPSDGTTLPVKINWQDETNRG